MRGTIPNINLILLWKKPYSSVTGVDLDGWMLTLLKQLLNYSDKDLGFSVMEPSLVLIAIGING